MKQIIRKISLFIISFVLFIGCFSSGFAIHAEEAEEINAFASGGNPLYPAELPENEILAEDKNAEPSKPVDPYYIQIIRDGMAKRDAVIEFEMPYSSEYEILMPYMINQAINTHTGAPKEGDYLKYHYTYWTCNSWGNAKTLKYTYKVTYRTTAAQETAVDTAVNKLINDLGVANKNDYQKVKTVQDWIADNIAYEYGTLAKDSPVFTAYGALINRKAVCQSYCVLFYRLMLELGVDCRVISGKVRGEYHTWNIVKLGDKYYNVDTTFAASAKSKTAWLLKGSKSFADHVSDAEFLTDTFKKDYPIDTEDYIVKPDDLNPGEIVERVVINQSALTLDEGTTAQLSAQVLPAACSQRVLWSSGNTAVASVDQNGLVTAIKTGTTVITAEAGGKKATCTVTVKEPVHEYGTPEYTWSGDSRSVTAKAVCTICGKEVTETVNTTVEYIKEPTAHERGRGKFTAVFTNELFTTQVREAVIPSFSERTVTLNMNEATLVYGQTMKLNATVEPAEANQQVTWTSSDSKIASVDAEGNVTGVLPGRCVITATIEGGDTDTCELRILFKDASKRSQYFYEPVYWAFDNGITVGAGGPGKFSPGAACTREQIVTFLWRLMGEPEPETASEFTDVAADAWYYKPITWAYENEITTGLNDGTGRFGIGLPCTREQCVTFLHRAAGKPEVAEHQEFTDVEEDRYYYDAISWAASKEITLGLNDGTGRFGVGVECTRGMIVTFLYRYAEQ